MDQQNCTQQVLGTHDAPTVSGTFSAKLKYENYNLQIPEECYNINR